ncbi:MAG: hypothetical protein ACTSSP_00495 [Candidatus Asgardarchaeia archaeon]
MKKIFLILLLLSLITAAWAGTRRTREQEYLKGSFTIEEGMSFSRNFRACDVDGDPLIIEIDDLPPGATLSDAIPLIWDPDPNHCNNESDPNYCMTCFSGSVNTSWYISTFDWTPDYTQAGFYQLHLHVMDDQGGDDWVMYEITVTNVDQGPGTRRPREDEYLAATINVSEGELVSATIRTCDVDGDPIQIEVEDLPAGAILSDAIEIVPSPDPNVCDEDPNNMEACLACLNSPTTSWYSATITWTPDYSQAGQYKLYVHSMSGLGGEDWVVIIINVADKNREPVL